MKVLLINKYHYLKGGAERAYFDTAHILAENGHEVSFFSMQHPDNRETPWSRYFVSNVDYLTEPVSFLAKIRLAWRIIWNSEAAENLEQLLLEAKPDIAHLHNIYHQLSPSILWTLHKHHVPIVMTLHDYKLASPNYSLYVRGAIWNTGSSFRCIADRCVKNSFAKSFVCAVEKWVHESIGSYRKVSVFLSPSQFLIEKFRELGSPFHIERVPQPLLPFPEQPSSKTTNDYLLFFGRLSVEKGVSVLLEAMQELPEKKLCIVGVGPEEEALKNFVKTKNLTNISFLGPKYGDELQSLIRDAEAIVMPSVWYENMPYTILEALAIGKVVIASRIGGIPERIQDGINGFLFETGNTKTLAHILRTLTQQDLAKIERAAFESVSDLRPEVYAKTLEKIYAETIG